MTTVPLKRLATVRVSNVDKKSVDGEPPVRLCNYTDVYYRDEITPGQEFMSATASPAQISAFRLRPDDVIITKDSETAEDIGVPTYVRAAAPDLVCGYHLAVLRPEPRLLDGRFLYWFMASTTARDQLAVAATGVTRFGLRADSTGGVLMPSWTVEQQRAIADYLDTETARIDALIAKKKALRLRVYEHFASLVEETVWAGSPERMPLRFRTKLGRPVMYGIVLPGPDVPEGVSIVKGGDVAADRLSVAALCRTTPEIEAPFARARLREGDVVFAIRGGIGDARLVPETVAGANITQDVARIAPADDVDPRWLLLVLRSASVQGEVAMRTTGATVRGLNIWDLKRIGVPSSGPIRQRRDLVRLLPIQMLQDRLCDALARQTWLLQEHRQALITAAVTGELDASRVA